MGTSSARKPADRFGIRLGIAFPAYSNGRLSPIRGRACYFRARKNIAGRSVGFRESKFDGREFDVSLLYGVSFANSLNFDKLHFTSLDIKKYTYRERKVSLQDKKPKERKIRHNPISTQSFVISPSCRAYVRLFYFEVCLNNYFVPSIVSIFTSMMSRTARCICIISKDVRAPTWGRLPQRYDRTAEKEAEVNTKVSYALNYDRLNEYKRFSRKLVSERSPPTHRRARTPIDAILILATFLVASTTTLAHRLSCFPPGSFLERIKYLSSDSR